MLIVAIPKSASTSLMKTLGNIHGISSKQDFSFLNNPIPEESNVLYNYHSDIRGLTELESNRFASPDCIYKQHVFPTENNLTLLKDVKKVVLLRTVEDIIAAYRRGAQKGVHNLLPGYKVEEDLEEWLNRAKKNGLYQDLDFFFNKWVEEAESNSNTIIIFYEELISSPKRVMNKIEEHFKLPVTEGEVELLKLKYSREKKRKKKKGIKKSFIKVAQKLLSTLGLRNFVRKIRGNG